MNACVYSVDVWECVWMYVRISVCSVVVNNCVRVFVYSVMYKYVYM